MIALRRVAAIYMLWVAVAVAVHFLATQLYPPALADAASTAWRILDPLMVLGVVMVLVFAVARKCRLAAGSAVDREYLETNFTFYFSAMLLLLLLWNWFGFEWVDPETTKRWYGCSPTPHSRCCWLPAQFGCCGRNRTK